MVLLKATEVGPAPRRRMRRARRARMRTNRNVRVVNPLSKGLVAWNSAAPFPRIKYCSVSYADHYNLTSGVLSIFGTEQRLTLNGLFDPDITGVGHQPYGFDQLMAIYGFYKVYAVKVELEWFNPSLDGLVVGYKVFNHQDTVPLAGQTYGRAKEFYGIVTKPLQASGSQRLKMTYYTPINKVSGITKLQFKSNTDLYQGNAGGNPILTPFIALATVNPQAALDISVSVGVKITYFSSFFNRLELTQS